jgi:SAM-dependent methyltransferase
LNPPSPFLVAERERLLEAARRGPVLDLACGRGRNALPAASWGARVVGFDRNPEFLAELCRGARRRALPVQAVRSDLETPHGIPVRAASCAAILVFRFLFRPLAPAIVEALAPGGLLLYETFTLHQRQLAHGPVNPAFLLHDGELAEAFPALETLHYWEGVTPGPEPEAVARLAARKR